MKLLKTKHRGHSGEVFWIVSTFSPHSWRNRSSRNFESTINETESLIETRELRTAIFFQNPSIIKVKASNIPVCNLAFQFSYKYTLFLYHNCCHLRVNTARSFPAIYSEITILTPLGAPRVLDLPVGFCTEYVLLCSKAYH